VWWEIGGAKVCKGVSVEGQVFLEKAEDAKEHHPRQTSVCKEGLPQTDPEDLERYQTEVGGKRYM